jgi:hypothetical protein
MKPGFMTATFQALFYLGSDTMNHYYPDPQAVEQSNIVDKMKKTFIGDRLAIERNDHCLASVRMDIW